MTFDWQTVASGCFRCQPGYRLDARVTQRGKMHALSIFRAVETLHVSAHGSKDEAMRVANAKLAELVAETEGGPQGAPAVAS